MPYLEEIMAKTRDMIRKVKELEKKGQGNQTGWIR
jgi:hypothetical protein